MPSDRITHGAQRYVSPDGTLGYLAIHRCGSGRLGQHLQYGLPEGQRWIRGKKRNLGTIPGNPNVTFDGCTEVLVVVRDPMDRWVSAAALVEEREHVDRQGRRGRRGGNVEDRIDERPGQVWTNDDDAHFASQHRFIAPYAHLPLRFVELADVDDWLTEHGIPLPPADIDNESDPAVKDRLKARYDRGARRARIRAHYADDDQYLTTARANRPGRGGGRPRGGRGR